MMFFRVVVAVVAVFAGKALPSPISASYPVIQYKLLFQEKSWEKLIGMLFSQEIEQTGGGKEEETKSFLLSLLLITIMFFLAMQNFISALL